MAAPNHADVSAAAAAAIQRVRPLLASQFAHIDVGIAPGLLGRMRMSALTDLLEEMLATAVHAAPASHLLLTALRQGDQIEIVVADDLAGANATYRQTHVRGLNERVALRGGSLQVIVHPSTGTTTTLRVLAAAETHNVAASLPTAPASPHKPAVAVEDGGA